MSVWQPLGPEKIIICAASVSSTMPQTLGCCQCSFKMQCFCKFTDFRALKLYWPSATFTQLVLPFLSDFNHPSLQGSLLVMSFIFQSTNHQMLTDIPSVPDVLLDTCREHAKKKKKIHGASCPGRAALVQYFSSFLLWLSCHLLPG